MADLAAALAATALAVALATVPIAAPSTAVAGPLGDDFLWGVATSGFQSEGSAPDSNWVRYSAAGRTDDPVGNAVDFRHRYAEDIDNAAGLGVDVFRFGVEWARVQPEPGRWDETEFAYYDDVVRRIRDHGMTPMITLDHWVYPGWIADRGGWADPRTVDDWLVNAGKVVDRYRDVGAIWITFNEPTTYAQRELTYGGISLTDVPRMFDGMTRAHREIYDRIHALDPTARVGSNLAFVPAVFGALDPLFVDRVTDKLDFLGIDYYYGASLDNVTAIAAATDRFYDVVPQPDGIYHALTAYHRKLPGMPLYVVENGMATDDGQPRPDGYTRSDHLRDHVYWIERARADGADVIGYNYWSITDNYEWGSYRPRFGLYTVDAVTDPALTRRPTDAVTTYRDVVAADGVPDDYHPVRPAAFCSLVDPLFSCLGSGSSGS
ncbi:glycoside hydrolase family 1 protein [Prescottella subtropica]|uniref:glycoside hydrolase family 1 protein n=1 Tax=Prescottella subtropica TaxID=2545757 RepID=UPI0010F60054|nr:family 1 glycosylhydrolase [Prescottella subtropica]